MQLSIRLRPRTLDEVYGQSTVVKALKKRIMNQDIPNAMLLKGMTGTGKTTVAQIIAMALNCTDNNTPSRSPCGKCASCRSIMEEKFDRNTVRLDGGASSKSDVLDFARLVEGAPFYDRNKVFIIEETDQLSTAAKNSLLKILEKPMKNVFFILLSMTLNGIPKAIQDRCQTFNFWAFSKKDVMLALQEDLKRIDMWGKEGIPLSFYTEVVPCIADSSQGSLRAAIQAVETCLSGEIYTLDEVKKDLGIVSTAAINKMILSLLDLKKEFFPQFEEIDMQEFFNLSYTIISSAAVYRITKQVKNEYFEEQTKKLSEHKNLIDVLKLFDDIQSSSGAYLKKSLMLSKITQFYFGKKVTRIIDNE